MAGGRQLPLLAATLDERAVVNLLVIRLGLLDNAMQLDLVKFRVSNKSIHRQQFMCVHQLDQLSRASYVDLRGSLWRVEPLSSA